MRDRFGVPYEPRAELPPTVPRSFAMPASLTESESMLPKIEGHGFEPAMDFHFPLLPEKGGEAAGR